LTILPPSTSTPAGSNPSIKEMHLDPKAHTDPATAARCSD
jgi:hypothetical protein